MYPNCRRCTMLPQSKHHYQYIYIFSIRAFTNLQSMKCPACTTDFFMTFCSSLHCPSPSCWKCLTVVCVWVWSISAPLTRSQLITGTNTPVTWPIFFFIWGLMVKPVYAALLHQLNWSVEIYSIVFKKLILIIIIIYIKYYFLKN